MLLALTVKVHDPAIASPDTPPQLATPMAAISRGRPQPGRAAKAAAWATADHNEVEWEDGEGMESTLRARR